MHNRIIFTIDENATFYKPLILIYMAFCRTFFATSVKIFLLILPILLLATTTFAQKESKKNKKVYFSIGPELAVPVGYFSRINKFGFGGSAILEVKAAQPVGITLNVGYIKHKMKDKNGYPESDIDQVFAMLGGRYYFDQHFFASGQVGLSAQQDVFAEFGGSVIIAPGIGYKHGLLDATLKYMTANREYSSLSDISLRVAIAF